MATRCVTIWAWTTATMLLIVAALLTSLPGVGGQGDDLTYNIPEELPPGRVIANISRDANISREVGSAELSSLQYRLLLQTPETPRPLFSVDLSWGILRVNNSPDREEVCEYLTTCSFQVRIAIQSSVHQFFRTLQVRIFIDDINDNDPTFATPVISLPISESVSIGASFIIEGATDLDTGPNNSVVLYDLVPRSDTFGLKVIPKFDGGSRISLVVNAPLDREEVESYRLGVVAWDGGIPARSGHLTINVTVTDVNDVTPEFTQRIYNVSVNETLTRDDQILRLRARDTDSGRNGDVRYRLAPRQTDSIVGTFAVNEVTGSLTAASPLTSLQGQTVRVIVEAYDMGDEPRVSQAIVYINILDSVNDPPVPTLSILSGGSRSEIKEDVTPGHVVAHLTVTDTDAGENGMVTCTLLNAYFELRQLKQKEYKIIVTGSLDRERQEEHAVRVTCRDSGSPPLLANIAFVVELLDVNDNVPVFVGGNTYSVNVTENNNIKIPLLFLTAMDADAGANGDVTYEIVTHSALEWVQVNRTSGVVMSLKPFDFELIHGINFTVVATDGGKPALSAEARVKVTVYDLNDNPPNFLQDVFVMELEENQPGNVIVGHVEAEDPDLGPGGRVTYQLMPPPNVTLNFTVSLQGLVRATSSFDREQGARHEFDVVARDQGVPQRMSIARVIINIGDLNDNPPVIYYPNPENNTASIRAGVMAGTEVLRVVARDADVGYNSVLRYELHVQQKSRRRRRRSSDRLFRVDSTGVIRAARAIRSGDVGQHSCLLIVKDSGNPEYSAEARFSIVVEPGNATAALGDSESVRHAYIVIILLCVTAVIAAVVVAVIIRFRRADRRKRGGVSTGVTKIDRMVDSPVRRPVPESDGGSVKDDKTAAMIFQSERERGEHREGPKDTLIMFKMQLAQDYNASDNNSMIHESPRSTTSFGKGPGGGRGAGASAQGEGEGSDPHTTRLAALRVQQTLMQRSAKPPPPHKSLGPERHSTCSERCPDDMVSDSSGETAATDSGRGCSEGDSQSQERDSLQSNTDDCSLRGGLASRTGARSAPPMEKAKEATPRPRSCVVPVYPRVRESRTAPHPHPHLGGPNRTFSMGGKYPTYTQPARRSTGWGSDVRWKADPRGGPLGSMELYNPHSAFYGKGGMRPPEGLVFAHGGNVPMEVLNDSYDDDNTTTTSGSYTIDPEDYQGEVIGYPPNDIYV